MTSTNSESTAYSDQKLDSILEIANKCIGGDIVQVKPISAEEYYNEWKEALSKLDRKPNKDEYISQGFDILTGKPVASIEKIPLRIDYSKDWKSYLTSNDYANLQQYNFTEDVLDNWEGPIGIADRDDDILIIRTKSSTWRALAGREWHYDRSTGLLKLTTMN